MLLIFLVGSATDVFGAVPNSKTSVVHSTAIGRTVRRSARSGRTEITATAISIASLIGLGAWCPTPSEITTTAISILCFCSKWECRRNN